MNREEVIVHLLGLMNDCKEYEQIETKEEDVQALLFAINALQEQSVAKSNDNSLNIKLVKINSLMKVLQKEINSIEGRS